MRSYLYLFFVTSLLLFISTLSSCVKRPFVPVNEGREYGNPTTPLLVSHLPESNQFTLARTRHHFFFQKILCAHYPCRKMIGRRKALNAISFEEYRKRIRKNAKKGLYKKTTPTSPKPPAIKTIQPDTVIAQADTVLKVPSKEAIETPAAAAPILKADSLITLSEFLFELNSHKLKPEHFPKLDSLSQFLKARPTLEVRVSGHTDSTGNERHNVVLSTRRAEVVAEYLISKGVDYNKVFFEGFGSSRPISGNESEKGRSKNRRVEILMKNPKKE